MPTRVITTGPWQIVARDDDRVATIYHRDTDQTITESYDQLRKLALHAIPAVLSQPKQEATH